MRSGGAKERFGADLSQPIVAARQIPVSIRVRQPICGVRSIRTGLPDRAPCRLVGCNSQKISVKEMGMFEGFQRHRVTVGDADLNVLTGGKGFPVLLLHGYPQTHAIWHKVAPLLATKFTLVMPDLPGYGASRGPLPDAANQRYAKRSTARLLAELMSHLGHQQFGIAGHDRGGRVGFRLALDYPEQVLACAPLDIVPTLYAWETMDWVRALDDYHWLFLAQPSPVPERLIGN